jgi:large-conductance mechanosensitive channel
MRKSIAALIDELIITNIKIFMLVDKVQKNEHTLEDAKKLQELNSYRSELINAINKELNEKQKIIKI